MTKCIIAVRLKAPDPEAVTALNTISSMGLQLPPAKLNRYDVWEFDLKNGDKEIVEEIVGHFTDIVNPNKHLWSFVIPGEMITGQNPGYNWTGLLISDTQDSVGANWTDILRRRGFPVESVHRRILWMFGYLMELDDSLVDRMAMDLAVSSNRTGGLLSNPVFQEVRPWT